jgi:hypothetical protein
MCTYIHYPYTRDVLVELLVFFEDVGEVAVRVELDTSRHSGVVEYVKEKCVEYVEEAL